MSEDLDWAAIRDYYEAGHTKQDCRGRFGISDWDWHSAVGRADIVPRVKGEPVRTSQKRALIARLRSQGLSYGRICRRLGISKATVAYHVRRMGVVADDKPARRYDWAEVQNAINEGMSMRECRARFGFSHSAWDKAVKRGAITPRDWIMPIDELLVVGRKTGRGHLKRRLIKLGLKENRCEECGITEWRGKTLKMELHHVNGDGTDNRLENLQLLCGNCHSQTDNWGGRGLRRNGNRPKVGAG